MKRSPPARPGATDLLIILLGGLLIALLYSKTWQAENGVPHAVIHSLDQPALQVSLQTDRRMTVQGRLGPSTLEVHAGKIRFLDSPCSQHLCVHRGWLAHSGEATACLPNGVSVVLHGTARRYDSINF